MTPADSAPAPPRPDAGPGDLATLLAGPAPAAATASQRLAAAAGAALGARVTVHVDQPGGDVSGGRVSLRWDPQTTVDDGTRTMLRHACVWLSTALDRDDARDQAANAARETEVVRDVVGRLLSVRDLDQVLLSIADRTLHLLDSDICGVLLVEGDEVRMRSCVGNRVVDTGRLRMRRGQGVAGLVFQTGEPAKVDNYLVDTTISDDFMSLAEQEETRSALAVPLRLHGELIGVLEVWRRRPSVFTERDTRRMVTLADFATIAIDNARLHDQQASAVRQLKEARDALEGQVAVLASSSSLQRKLLTTVLDGVGLPAISRTVATELGCRIAVYGPDGGLIAQDGTLGRAELPSRAPTRIRPGRKQLRLSDGTAHTVWLQPIHADGDHVGSLALVPGQQTPEMMDVVAGQVAMACSLTLLRERAASRARAEELEQVLWDLVQGSVEHRIAARTRAKQLNVVLRGDLRVLYGRVDHVEDLAAARGWDTSQTDRLRRDVLRTLRGLDESRGLALSSMRGDVIVAIGAQLDRAAAKDTVTGLTGAVRRQWPELTATWGISRSHDDVVDLPSALNEARTAFSAAHRLGGETVFLYEELGIVRLLLGSGDDPDLQTFVDEVTGPLIGYDQANNGALIRTLRAFFDADCSQRVAAERLFVHYKTLRYRLGQIEQLTGLDLSRHDDRMRADFALRLLQVASPLGSVDDADGAQARG